MLFILGLVLGVLVGAVAMMIFDFDIKIEYITGKSAGCTTGKKIHVYPMVPRTSHPFDKNHTR